VVTGEGRAAHVVAARWRWMRAAYDAGYGSPAIGRAFGKDHTTVLAAIKRVGRKG
jgi:chromosomal replication initiation ATPase DnaA